MSLRCLFFFIVAPSPVRNVHARPLSSNTVEVSWTAPNQTRGTIVLYSVLYKKENVCCLQVYVYTLLSVCLVLRVEKEAEHAL